CASRCFGISLRLAAITINKNLLSSFSESWGGFLNSGESLIIPTTRGNPFSIASRLAFTKLAAKFFSLNLFLPKIFKNINLLLFGIILNKSILYQTQC